MKRAWIAFWTTLILVLPIRIFTVLRYLNPQTGFYADNGKMVGTASILLFVGIILSVIFVGKSAARKLDMKSLRNIPTAVLGALAGIFVLIQSIVGLSTGSLGAGQIFYRIFSVAGILAGVVLILAAYDFATGSSMVANRPLLALILPVWGCLFLVVLFITYSAVVNLVENVYHTFTVVFLLLFLFMQAKLLTGIESDNTGKTIYMVGYPAALLALVTALPSCIQFFSVGETAGVVPIGMHMANIVLAFYIIAFLLALQNRVIVEEPQLAEEAVLPSAEQKEEQSDDLKIEQQDKEDPLAMYVAFLDGHYGGSRMFACVQPSPFYSRESVKKEES